MQILIIDDRHSSMYLERLLEYENHNTDFADNFFDAISLIEEHGEDFYDVFIVDLVMPHYGLPDELIANTRDRTSYGLTFVHQWLLARFPRLHNRVILITGASRGEFDVENDFFGLKYLFRSSGDSCKEILEFIAHLQK